MNSDLNKAFTNTKYSFPDVSIEIGKRSEALDALLAKHKLNSWAIITAYNPQAKLQDAALNIAAQKELKEKLSDYLLIEGMNIAEDEKWNEPSFLVLGISSQMAKDVAEAFRQVAIVYGELGAEAKLVEIQT